MLAGAASAPAATTVNMVLWPGPEGDAMQKVVDAWNKEQGAEQGVHVKMILLSRDKTFSRETTEIGAKSSNIDIYFVASYNVNFYQAGLEPIDTIGVDESNYFKSAIDSLKIGGKLYALPLDVSNHFLYYRKDLIARLLSDDAWKSKYRDIRRLCLARRAIRRFPPNGTLTTIWRPPPSSRNPPIRIPRPSTARRRNSRRWCLTSPTWTTCSGGSAAIG
jgi:multiple sugar transport system substrate-binding protein